MAQETINQDMLDKIDGLLNPETSDEQQTNDKSQEEPEAAATEAEEPDAQNQEAAQQSQESEPADDVSEDGIDELPLETVANVLGLDPSVLDVDENGQVLVRTKVDGEEKLVKPSELIKSFQLEQHVHKKSEEVSQAKKQAQQTLEDWGRQLAEAQQLIQQAYAQLQSEAQGIDWETLREENPAEYAARKAELLEKEQKLQQQAAQFQQQLAQYQQAQIQQQTEFLSQETKKVIDEIPEWKDENIRKQEATELTNWLREQGWTDAELATIVTAHQVKALRLAWLAAKGQQKMAKVSQQKTVRKTLKPGRAVTQSDRQRKNMQQKIARARKSGDVNAWADVLTDVIE